MEQVLTNLIVNAIKYTDPGGRIVVSVGRDEHLAVVRVTDNGIGIGPDLLPRVFEVFVQGHQDLDRAEGGLGIGLTLVRKLVELHGGTIEALSAGPGKGSTFCVRLPLMEGAPAPLPVAPPAIASLGPLRILVVEDNDDAREMLRRYLEIYGHQVHEAADGPTAVEAGREARPHLALVDIGLPGFDGLEVARRLRADPATAGCFLVALTGYSQEQDRERALENGFDAHLVKPASGEGIAAVLKSACHHAAVPATGHSEVG
jgi:CheY-like chemotaxis protein